MIIAKDELHQICITAGQLLQPALTGCGCADTQGKPLDAARLLWAIAGNESSFGANCAPRYESAYAPGGSFYRQSKIQRDLYAQYGRDAACSYGPWQILPCNALGTPPEELGKFPLKAALAAAKFIASYVIGVRRARTLAEILDTYNSGTWRDAETPGVRRYIADGIRNYATWPEAS